MSQEFNSLVVDSVIEQTPDSRSIVFEIPSGLRDRFVYAAGQFVTLELPWDGFHIRRCYSLSSAPDLDAAPAITVKRVEGGRASNWLIDHLKPGDPLRVSLPEGRFVLDPADVSRPLLLFAAGSGITPVLSLLKTALHRSERQVALLYANRDANSVIFDAELSALARQFQGRLSLTRHLDSDAGYLTAAALAGFLRDKTSSTAYVCGPAPFMDAVEAALEAAGVPESRMHFERFVSPPDPDRQPEQGLPSAPTRAPESFEVRLGGRDHRVPYTAGQTLLEAAHAAGLRAPSSCESGYCGSCMAQLSRGEVAMRTREALTDRSIEKGRVLLCQAVPRSDAPLAVDCDATSFRIERSTRHGDHLTLRRAVGFLIALFVVTAVWVLRTRT